MKGKDTLGRHCHRLEDNTKIDLKILVALERVQGGGPYKYGTAPSGIAEGENCLASYTASSFSREIFIPQSE